MPARIQRRRTKGWRAPAGAKYVGRGTRWGNPWTVVQTRTGWGVNWVPLGRASEPERPWTVAASSRRAAHVMVVTLFREYLDNGPELVERARLELAGRDLMCWCAPEFACHVDVWLAVANAAPLGPVAAADHPAIPEES
jgi:hypothetical protein